MQGPDASPLPILPPHGARQKIGLFGGSVNPAHAAHRLVSLLALRRLALDAVWWLVTPGNPLKDHTDLAPLAQRMEAAKLVAAHPRIHVTDFESALGSAYTIDSLTYLKQRSPVARFVWIMGADNLQSFHSWADWREIIRLMPIAVVDRPGSTLSSRHARAALAFQSAFVAEEHSAHFANRHPPAMIFLHGPRSPLSSTLLRQAAQPS